MLLMQDHQRGRGVDLKVDRVRARAHLDLLLIRWTSTRLSSGNFDAGLGMYSGRGCGTGFDRTGHFVLLEKTKGLWYVVIVGLSVGVGISIAVGILVMLWMMLALRLRVWVILVLVLVLA